MDKQFTRIIRKSDKDKPAVLILNKIANEEKEQPKEEQKKGEE